MISSAEVKHAFFLAALKDESLQKRPTIAIDVRTFWQILKPIKKFVDRNEY